MQPTQTINPSIGFKSIYYVPNPLITAQLLSEQVLEDSVVFAFCIIAVVEARDMVMLTKISKKKDLAKSADVEMADATKPGPLMQSMIDKAVSTQLKSLLKPPGPLPQATPYVPKPGQKVPDTTKGAQKKWQKSKKGKGKAKAT
ncbi:hypothetical protein L208DRAFT_1382310 [Tricholoma matsutake]|nr:hypothetical protein L208DRAFT_1382310 [Tricholoma matsutake 945]